MSIGMAFGIQNLKKNVSFNTCTAILRIFSTTICVHTYPAGPVRFPYTVNPNISTTLPISYTEVVPHTFLLLKVVSIEVTLLSH